MRIGIPICEDIWGAEVVECLGETGGEILLVPNGSPYWRGKTEHRLNIAVARVVESGLPLIYLNMVGGQDELVFDGASFVLQRRPQRRRAASGVPRNRRADAMEARGRHVALRRRADRRRQDENEKTDYAACVLGLRDYVEKNGFKGVVLGLSGGIDSALCAAMAVDALGAERVRCVMLPYRYTSQDSLDDAAAMRQGARRAVRHPADRAARCWAWSRRWRRLFAGKPRDVTEENLQARARGTILMAISNKFGLMVVTTGNKSEMSVGYATLYGDMNGGFNPIKDLYKTEVFRLSRLRNAWKPDDALGPDGEVIPENIIAKPPTAELRENQKDQDSLPPYDMLDAILERLVEREEPIADDRRRGLRPRHRAARSNGCSISRNTSGGRRRPASR